MDNEMLLEALGKMIDEKLDNKLEPIKQDISNIKEEVTSINLKLENEIEPRIQLIAEQHTSIVEKIDTMDKKIDKMSDKLDVTSIATEINIKDIKDLKKIARLNT